jgi:hypothetical protein
LPREIPQPSPEDLASDDDAEGEESEEETADADGNYKGVSSLVWLDAFNEIGKLAIDDFDEGKFELFKVIVDEKTYKEAVQHLADATTLKRLEAIATRCKVKATGSKLLKVETLTMWKAGL